jgi:hypothetical protein
MDEVAKKKIVRTRYKVDKVESTECSKKLTRERVRLCRARKKARAASVGDVDVDVGDISAKRRKRYVAKKFGKECGNVDVRRKCIATSVADRQNFGGILCGKWFEAEGILRSWKKYCRNFFENAKACANCGKFVYGGKHSMHYSK